MVEDFCGAGSSRIMVANQHHNVLNIEKKLMSTIDAEFLVEFENSYQELFVEKVNALYSLSSFAQR